MNVVYFILALAGGLASIQYRKRIVDFTGHLGWAEQYLGAGGSHNVWLIIGLGLIAFSFYALFNM